MKKVVTTIVALITLACLAPRTHASEHSEVRPCGIESLLDKENPSANSVIRLLAEFMTNALANPNFSFYYEDIRENPHNYVLPKDLPKVIRTARQQPTFSFQWAYHFHLSYNQPGYPYFKYKADELIFTLCSMDPPGKFVLDSDTKNLAPEEHPALGKLIKHVMLRVDFLLEAKAGRAIEGYAFYTPVYEKGMLMDTAILLISGFNPADEDEISQPETPHQEGQEPQ